MLKVVAPVSQPQARTILGTWVSYQNVLIHYVAQVTQLWKSLFCLELFLQSRAQEECHSFANQGQE